MGTDSFNLWRASFLDRLGEPAIAAPLKEAAIAGKLTDWTASLTAAVVRSCTALGWRTAGKGHRLALLPQAGQEYLGIDVMAFAPTSPGRWPLPLAAFELENHARDDRVAYSLWKVLCLRVALRVVFAYRPDWEQGNQLVSTLRTDVIGGLLPEQRIALEGQSVVVWAIGGRAKPSRMDTLSSGCWTPTSAISIRCRQVGILGRWPMYVTGLEIENLRCFEKAKVSLLYPKKPGVPKKVLGNVTLLLGVNGAGKRRY